MKPKNTRNNLHKKQRAYRFGLLAECVTILLLLLKGYRILAWRYRNKAGEVDIIAARKNTVAMVEVKARRKKLYEVVSPHQQQRLTRAASLFLAKYPKHREKTVRFDVVLVSPFQLPEHIQAAWVE